MLCAVSFQINRQCGFQHPPDKPWKQSSKLGTYGTDSLELVENNYSPKNLNPRLGSVDSYALLSPTSAKALLTLTNHDGFLAERVSMPEHTSGKFQSPADLDLWSSLHVRIQHQCKCSQPRRRHVLLLRGVSCLTEAQSWEDRSRWAPIAM